MFLSNKKIFEEDEKTLKRMESYRCCGKCKNFKYTESSHNFGTCTLSKGEYMSATCTADKNIFGNWNCDCYVFNRNWKRYYINNI